MKPLSAILLMVCFSAIAKPRARELGVPFDGTPGKLNAITDVKGVEVGQVSVTHGKAKKGNLHVARTGVTVIFPVGKKRTTGVPAAWTTLNGNGEMTGTAWVEDSGLLEGPISLTNTQSVGVVRDAMVAWVHKHFPKNDEEGLLPLVGETDDSWVNNLYDFNVKKEHVFEAADDAEDGPVEEGCVGAGTGTVTFGFKAGIGTASRVIEGGYNVGVLVQSNFGRREELRITGVPVGTEMKSEKLPIENPLPRRDGSINVIVATDAPLLPHQMKRIVRRAALGLARTGSVAHNSSGDFFVGFSTAIPTTTAKGLLTWTSLPMDRIDDVFRATVEATEEAIINALVAAEDMSGMNGNTYYAMPHDRLKAILKKYNRLKN